MDKTNKKTGTSKTVSSGQVTTTTVNELYFGVAWSMTHNDTWTAGTGYTKRQEERNNNDLERHVTEDKVGNAQTTAATFTTGTNSAYAAAIATFKPKTTSGSSGTTTLRFVTTDQLSGANIITDSAGNIVETLDYYPYGTIRTDTKVGSYTGEKRKFIGQEYDNQTQLSYLNARYYDGSKGRFISQDPVFWEIGQSKEGKAALMNPQAQNSYSYANNNPVTLSDPNGRFAPLIVLGVIWAAAELGLTSYDVYNAVGTVSNPNASWTDKGISIAGVGIGLIALGGGYGKVGKEVAGDVSRNSTLRNWTIGRAESAMKNLEAHFDKHGAEVGAKSVTDYYKKANDFIGKNITYSFRDPFVKNGDMIHYNPMTNQKVVTDRSGSIKSYYVENRQSYRNTYDSIINKK